VSISPGAFVSKLKIFSIFENEEEIKEHKTISLKRLIFVAWFLQSFCTRRQISFFVIYQRKSESNVTLESAILK
jgi:hypothetical protein